MPKVKFLKTGWWFVEPELINISVILLAKKFWNIHKDYQYKQQTSFVNTSKSPEQKMVKSNETVIIKHN